MAVSKQVNKVHVHLVRYTINQGYGKSNKKSYTSAVLALNSLSHALHYGILG